VTGRLHAWFTKYEPEVVFVIAVGMIIETAVVILQYIRGH